MVRTGQLIAHNASQRKAHAPVWAAVLPGLGLAIRATPQGEIVTEQAGRQHPVTGAQGLSRNDRMPGNTGNHAVIVHVSFAREVPLRRGGTANARRTNCAALLTAYYTCGMALHDTPAGAVLVVGAANMDITGSTRNPLTPGDSIPGHIRSAPGGVARNVAENLARLGTPVQLLAAVGDDAFGNSLLASTSKAGVGVSGCWVLPGLSTSTYMSVHGPDGDMAIAINDLDIVENLTPQRLAGRQKLLQAARALMLDCNLSGAALQYLFENAAGRPVFVDAVSAFKCRRVLPWLAGIHTLKVNQLEARALSGIAHNGEEANAGMVAWLHAQGVFRVVLSLGERGVYWSERGGAHGLQKPPPVQVVNVTGAGDALMAGLLHQTVCGAPLQQAVRFASACAALTLLVPGANHPGLSDAAVHQLLANGHLPD